VLATSREVLHLRGEQEVGVEPLAVPDPTHLPPLDQLSQYAAVALFIQRVQASQPSFQVTNANAPAVAQISVRLDGLPLAIELAAARVKLFPPEALLARLSSRLALLTGGARDLPARQQTLRHTIAWSYDLLNEAEQALFRRLGVFVGGCTLEASEAVSTLNVQTAGPEPAAGFEPSSVLDRIAGLLDKSLVRQAADGDEPRLIMLETIREYALEQLELRGEAAAVRRQHAAYYLTLAETAEAPLRGASQLHRARLETEHDNLRAALAWAQGSDDAEMFVRLAGALGRFWQMQGHFSEAVAWLAHAVARSSTVSAAVRAKALYQAGRFSYDQASHLAAGGWLEQSLALYQELGRPQEIADVLVALGERAWNMGDYARAETWYEAALPLFRNIGDQHGMASVLMDLGSAALWQSDYWRAGALFDEALALFRSLGDTNGIARGFLNLGHLARAQEDDARAAACYDEALTLAQAAGNKDMIGSIRHNQAYLALHQGEHARAEALLVESLVVSRAVG
ncbi:MAG TPA: tetratricopeptide repeat protein, partial [Roseiflexaceae bacterium]